jgi:hypothetical protein
MNKTLLERLLERLSRPFRRERVAEWRGVPREEGPKPRLRTLIEAFAERVVHKEQFPATVETSWDSVKLTLKRRCHSVPLTPQQAKALGLRLILAADELEKNYPDA